MSSLKYWEHRQAERMFEYMQSAEDTADEISKLYQKASRYISHELDRIFERYKRKHHLTDVEAYRLLNTLRDKASLDELKQALKAPGRGQTAADLLAELESPAYQARLERLQQLQNQIDLAMQEIYNQEKVRNTSHYVDLANEAYYKSIFDIQQRTGVGFSFSLIDPKVIETVINSKWSGENYSKRIWNNTQALAKDLKQELLVSLITGRTDRETADIIANKHAQGASNARRLVRTESCNLANQMEMLSYEECGIETYIYVATLDFKTSEECRRLDGKRFPVAEQQPGKNCPPLHPWCRSTTICDISAEELAQMKRRARDPETGKTITVPADMTYDEWKKKYVDKQEESQKRYADRREERKQRHSQGWRRQFMRNGSAEPEKTWREKYNETVEKEAVLKERLDQLNQESRKWEEKYFETMEEEYAQKSLSNDPEIEDITKQLDKIQEEKKTYVKIRLTEAEKSMAEAGIAETVKLSEKMTVESIDILENSLREMVVDNRLPSLKGVRYDPSFINLYGGKDTVALYNWGDETMYIGEMLSDPDAYKQHRLLAERSYKKQHNEYEPTWKNTIDSLEKEIYEEDDSGRKKYLTKNRNDVLSGLISQRRLVAEDAKDAIIHEYGHHVHNKASSESNIFGSKELKSRKFAGSYEWGGVHEGKVTAAQVSDYAAESPLEAFAESFTAYVKGEDIPESLKSMVEGAIEKTGGKLKQPVVKVPDSGIIKLTDADQYVLNQYVSFDFYPINEKLRNGTPLTERENNMAEQLDSALQKLPLYRGNLSRSLYFGGDGDAIKECLNKFPVGEEICFKEFLSTTCGAELYNPDGEIQIFIENSRKGRDITNINSMEMEVLYERKSKFKVINVTEKAKKHWILLREG